MSKVFRILSLVLIVALCGCQKKEESRISYSDLKDIKKLIVAEMAVGKVGRIDDEAWYTVGKRIGIYSFDTYLKAYINMEELKYENVEIDEKNKLCKITLPPVRVQNDGHDLTINEEHMRVGRLRFNITSAERAKIKDEMSKEVKKELDENGLFRRKLIEKGENKARSYFGALLKSLGYEADIRFERSYDDGRE